MQANHTPEPEAPVLIPPDPWHLLPFFSFQAYYSPLALLPPHPYHCLPHLQKHKQCWVVEGPRFALTADEWGRKVTVDLVDFYISWFCFA